MLATPPPARAPCSDARRQHRIPPRGISRAWPAPTRAAPTCRSVPGTRWRTQSAPTPSQPVGASLLANRPLCRPCQRSTGTGTAQALAGADSFATSIRLADAHRHDAKADRWPCRRIAGMASSYKSGTPPVGACHARDRGRSPRLRRGRPVGASLLANPPPARATCSGVHRQHRIPPRGISRAWPAPTGASFQVEGGVGCRITRASAGAIGPLFLWERVGVRGNPMRELTWGTTDTPTPQAHRSQPAGANSVRAGLPVDNPSPLATR